VLAADYNFYGTRLVTASSDHRLKVWDKKRDTTWELVDSWRAHDAEITDVSRQLPGHASSRHGTYHYPQYLSLFDAYLLYTSRFVGMDHLLVKF